MADGRDAILSGIRSALGRGPLSDHRREALEARLRDHPVGLKPAMAPPDEDAEARLSRFRAKLETVAATTDRVAAWADVPGALATYLAAHNLPTDVAVAPDRRLDAIAERELFTVRRGPALPQDMVGVTVAVAGLAETGSVMLFSGPETPTSLNFLPDIHVICVPAGMVVDGYEDAWAALRGRDGGAVPRTVNLVTGPSRTGDIEQTIQLGAHGPRRVHVIVIDESAP